MFAIVYAILCMYTVGEGPQLMLEKLVARLRLNLTRYMYIHLSNIHLLSLINSRTCLSTKQRYLPTVWCQFQGK